jgi:AbrB family looped-hinge helix DNA binding protein
MAWLFILQRGQTHQDNAIFAWASSARGSAAFSLKSRHYHGNGRHMTIAHSRLTSQGQISIPSDIRRKLGITPGAVLEWEERDGEIVVRRAGRYSFEDVHKVLFPKGKPASRSSDDIREGIRRNIRKRHAGN